MIHNEPNQLMSETASGLLRAVVLIVATLMFAVVWSGDQQTQRQFVLARKAAAAQSDQILLTDQQDSETETVALTNSPPVGLNLNHEYDEESTLSEQPSFNVARVEIDMALPEGIAAGRYRVVEESGQMQTIRIRSSVAAAHERDIYLLDLPDGTRRVFIRMSQTDEPVRAAVPTALR